MTSFLKKFVFILVVLALLPQNYSAAQDASSYDKYTELLRKGSYVKEKDSFIEKVGNAPAVPLEITKAGIEKVLVWVNNTFVSVP